MTKIKNSLIFLLIGSLFTQDAHLSFVDVSLANSSIEVVLTNDMPVSGLD